MRFLSLKIAFRSLFSRRSRYAHSSIGWIALLGLILGISAQVVALSILTGFEKQFTESILGFNADLVLLRDGEISNPGEVLAQLTAYQKEGVRAITPFLYREGLIAHKSKVKGFVIKGIDIETFTDVYKLKFKALNTDLNATHLSPKDLVITQQDQITPIILGSDLAEYLGVSNEEPYVSILLPKGNIQKITDSHAFKKFRVIGTFASGLYEFDSQFALMDLGQAQTLFELPNVVTGYEMKVKNLSQASELAENMAKDFRFPFQALSWDELNAEIFHALKLEKKLFFIIMGLIVLVAAANLIGLVVILISEQSREISILKVMGMKNKTLKRIFTLQGLILAFLGVSLGCGLGWMIAIYLAQHSLVPIAKEVYLVSSLPIELNLKMISWIFGFRMLSSYLTAKLASRKILGLNLDL